MAVAFSPRLRPHTAFRFFAQSLLPTATTLSKSILPKPRLCFSSAHHSSPLPRRRCYCTLISSAGEGIKPPEIVDSGSKVGLFRKRLKIADIKGGPDQGLDRLGHTLLVRGWVRTIRMQSSVTFIEVNDGSCLSNMQCVVSSDAEGYHQVEAGCISTGASILVHGIIVGSPGSKQKVELKVNKIVMIGESDSSFPIQKKRVSREFLRTKAHLRPRTNTFGAIPTSPEAMDSSAGKIPKTDEGLIDWSQDFFGKPAFLTVSGQLNAETYATALSDVYTFGPTFRAENSNTSRHLAEFWMIEPELAFADLNDDMACATAYLQYVVRHILENCKEDMDFFNTWVEKDIINRLNDVAVKDFEQLTYTDAVNILLKANKKFEYPVKWGYDLQSEHERYITEEAFGGCPVIIRDYPKEIKAFYMRQNDDGKTVAAMDLLVPRVGELIGGSQREERLECLETRLDELKLRRESYWWYLDLRRYGSVPHAGFGLGFERLVQFATGIDNIRDAIPFPRTPGSAEF
ncbi:asparagine--tRNA ligase, chloroplastic/mitochondrial-like isoform X3 [Chenopodium quinoa]|uniref:asparagine--tRNA ligase, chloroplastic/mitochondrial-like isoform X3 n=1 Tax=Chenopodium quinoa TaxID=63459 RepID=UPI000B790162|nr:asparagine--tRNA ligase, chloroplastic/mitochondrial-like isoform X3 [Chenopodium quinoa]